MKTNRYGSPTTPQDENSLTLAGIVAAMRHPDDSVLAMRCLERAMDSRAQSGYGVPTRNGTSAQPRHTIYIVFLTGNHVLGSTVPRQSKHA
jgi:hypothetical protein